MFSYKFPNGWTIKMDFILAILLAITLNAYFQQRQADAVFWALVIVGYRLEGR